MRTQEPRRAGAVPEMTGKQFARTAGRIYWKPALALLVTAALFLAEALMSGQSRRAGFVIPASLVSLPLLFLYPLLTPRDGAPPNRSLLGMLVGLGAFIPYGLGCYLIFYEGVWGLVQLFGGFSVTALVWALVSCVLGFAVVNGTYRLTDLSRAVDEHRIIVRRSG